MAILMSCWKAILQFESISLSCESWTFLDILQTQLYVHVSYVESASDLMKNKKKTIIWIPNLE